VRAVVERIHRVAFGAVAVLAALLVLYRCGVRWYEFHDPNRFTDSQFTDSQFKTCKDEMGFVEGR
jgi:hypothetical protein